MPFCCRTAALRIFVSNIAQVNLPIAVTTRRLPQYRSIIARSAALPATNSRSLQTSCARNNSDVVSESHSVSNVTYYQLPQESSRDSATGLESPKAASNEGKQDGELNVDSTGVRVKKARWTEEQKEAYKKAKEKLEVKRAKRAKHRAKKESQESQDTHQTRGDTRDGPEKPKEKRSNLDPKKFQMEAKRNVREETRDPKTMDSWRIQKLALKEKFPEGWQPRKRLSPDAMAGIKALHAQFPEEYTTEKLSETFQISPEAIRRILRAKWSPSTEEDEDRQMRWFNRGKSVWSHWAELGKKPPVRWRKEGIVRDPKWNRPKNKEKEEEKEKAKPMVKPILDDWVG